MKKKFNADELEMLLKFIVGVILSMTLLGIIITVLYSLIFVTQPLSIQSPNDAEFFKLINPIATFLTGALSGIMLSKRDVKEDEHIYEDDKKNKSIKERNKKNEL